jgi:hypothetical protein
MIKILIAVVLLTLISLSVAASEQRVSCPLEVRDGAAMTSVASGVPVGSKALRLTSGGIMRGHPNGGGFRRPESITEKNGVTTTLFFFYPGDEKWLWCAYGEKVQVSRRMDDAATHCTLTYRDNKDGSVAEMHATCKPIAD